MWKQPLEPELSWTRPTTVPIKWSTFRISNDQIRGRQHLFIIQKWILNIFIKKIKKQELTVKYFKTWPSFQIQMNSFHNFVSELTKLTLNFPSDKKNSWILNQLKDKKRVKSHNSNNKRRAIEIPTNYNHVPWMPKDSHSLDT